MKALVSIPDIVSVLDFPTLDDILYSDADTKRCVFQYKRSITREFFNTLLQFAHRSIPVNNSDKRSFILFPNVYYSFIKSLRTM